jgi:MipA family protein
MRLWFVKRYDGKMMDSKMIFKGKIRKEKCRQLVSRLFRIFCGSVFLLILCCSAGSLFAEEVEAPPERPLWEIGLFTGAVRLPHYRGSDEHSSYVMPLPYLIYRGEILRADRDGLKGIFWSTERIETELSFSGSPPPADDNNARDGMPNLNAVLEVGPGIKFYLTDRKAQNPLYLRAGVRAAVSVDKDDLDMAYEGIHGDLKLIYRNRTWFEEQGVFIGRSAGIDFANREYHDYFYRVDQMYARPGRPAYDAEGGYSGFSLSANALKKLSDRWSVGAYYRWDNLSGAAYENSPLVKTENNHTVGLALIWKVLKSEKTSRYPTE